MSEPSWAAMASSYDSNPGRLPPTAILTIRSSPPPTPPPAEAATTASSPSDADAMNAFASQLSTM